MLGSEETTILLLTCCRCKQELLCTEFYADKSKAFGFSNTCKVCAKEYQKTRRAKQPELVSSQRKANRISRIEEVRAIAREYYANNAQAISIKNKEYYERNKEEILARNSEYTKTEKGRLSRKGIASRRRMAQGTITIKDISIILKHSPLCFWCNKPHDGTYHIDHFYPISLGGTNTIDNIVVACPKCNLTKSNKDPEIFARQICRSIATLYEEDYHEW